MMATRVSKLPLYFVLGCGTYSGYSFYNKFIYPTTKVEPPPTSLLDQRLQQALFSKPGWNDCYQIQKKTIQIANSDKKSIVDINSIMSELIAKSLFTSTIFTMEKHLVRKVGYWKHTYTKEELSNSRYNIGEKYGLWKVISKTNDQILFEWKDPYSGWTGVSYLSANVSRAKSDDNCIDIAVLFGTGSVKPLELPWISKLFTPFHGVYSRMLLVSTVDQFISEFV
eukprot:230040_1